VAESEGRSLTERLRNRIDVWLWGRNPREMTVLQRALLRQLQTAVLVFRDFSENQCLMKASSLTYYTMLSLVPLLALIFALLKAFGVQNQLQPLIVAKLNVGDGRIAGMILEYINNTQVAQLGVYGLIFLVVAVVSLLTNVEKTFNSLWGVKGARPYLRRFADYLTFVLIGPVLLVAAISITSTLLSNRLLQTLLEMQWIGDILLLVLKILPFFFMWLAFTALYIFMANVRIEWRAAFTGGMVSGTLWQLAQLGYVHFQVGVGRYNAIYGTMAALPIFMVWLYLSWVIVLFGFGVCYAKQNLRTSGRDLRAEEVSRGNYEQVALILLITLAQRFVGGLPALSIKEMSRLLYLPPRLSRSILIVLQRIGFVSEQINRDGHRCYQLGRSAEDLPVAEIFAAMRADGESVRHLYSKAQTRVARQLVLDMESLISDGMQGLCLKDLVGQLDAQDAGEDTTGSELPAPSAQ
jgi:membrane protein